MHLDRQADLIGWIALADCADAPARHVGRKARMLAQAGAAGLATPGGDVLSADAFWDALERCGAAGRARYLTDAALRLDPEHVLGIAADIADTLAAAPLARIAAPYAQALAARTDARPLVCRSSAAMEDGRDAAFPGMFLSVLDIASTHALADAIAACWRSVFAPMLLRYLLRVRPAAIDLSLALLVQPQVVAAWYGVCFSEDPLGAGGGMVAQLSDAAPDALVGGAPARLRFAWRDDGWRGDGAVPVGLDRLAAAMAVLRAHAGAPVDVEFALRDGDPEPVILQCRPLTHRTTALAFAAPDAVAARLAGVPCAPGRVVGRGVDGDVALVARLRTQDYPLVLAARAVVAGAATSPLSHAAILCRELGVPLVAGVGVGIADLAGRWLLVDGGSGEVATLAEGAPAELTTPPVQDEPDAVLGTTELLLRLLVRAEPGDDPDAVLAETLRDYRRSLGARAVRVVPGADLPAACAAELDALFGARIDACDLGHRIARAL